MNKSYLEKLLAIMSSSQEMDFEVLQSFVQETIGHFEQLKKDAFSEDTEKRKQALQEAIEIKDALEKKMKEITEKTGLTPEQMLAFVAGQADLNEDQWKVIENAREKLMGKEKKEGEEKFLQPAVKIPG